MQKCSNMQQLSLIKKYKYLYFRTKHILPLEPYDSIMNSNEI